MTSLSVSPELESKPQRAGDVALERVVFALVLLAVATSSWNAVEFGIAQLSDVLLVLAVFLGVTRVLYRRERVYLPVWIWLPALAVVAVHAFSMLLPVPDGYLSTRFRPESQLQDYSQQIAIEISSGGTAIRWLGALVVMPLGITLAVGAKNHRLAVVLRWWAAGTALSCLVAISDAMNITAISGALLSNVDSGGRQAGLSSQSVHLGFSAMLAVPVAVYLLGRRRYFVGAGLLVVLVVGLILSGSRGALAGAVLALLLYLLVRSPKELGKWVLILAPIVALTGVVASRAGITASSVLIDRSEDTTASSDLTRQLLAEQAVRDFANFPIRGIGLSVLTEAHSLYLQVVAAGGLVLLAGLVVLLIGSMSSAYRTLETNPTSTAVLVSIASWAAVGVIENQISDRYLYVTVGIACVLARGIASAEVRPIVQKESRG